MSTTSEVVTYTLSLPLSAVSVRAGHNPRRRFSKTDHEKLCSSIREDGIIHPIAVRKVDDRYEIIAGERRWRAAHEVGLSQIDAKVFECSEIVARRMSRVENLHREDLTVPEEAYLAQDQVDDCEGDYELAARTLGWSVSKLRHRLQLLHASSAVMDALMEDTILVCHAELLSTLPQAQQDSVLAKVVQFGATIAQLREQLQGVSIPLEQARFDKAGCLDCPHNSSQQSSLFAEHIGAARCTNSSCFSAKTAEWVEQRRVELKDDYAVVELRTEVLPGKTIPLVMEGAAGVGPSQYDACRSCAFRTCVIDNRVGPATGAVEGPLCSNTTCNAEKVQAHQAAQRPAPAPEKALPVTSVTAVPQQGDSDDHADTDADVPATTPAPAEEGAPQSLPKAARLAYQAVIRRAASAQVATEPRVLLALAAVGLLGLGQSDGGVLSDSDLPPNVAKKCGKDGKIAALLRMDKDTLQNLVVSLSHQYLGNDKDPSTHGVRVNVNRSVVKTFKVDLATHVVVDKKFLSDHTLPAVHRVLDESGFSQWHKEQPDGAKKHKALQALGKGKLIDAVLAAGFDFSGYIPSGVLAEMEAKH